MSWLNRYIAIPYKDHGRTFEGVDCFGLYMLLLANEAEIDIAEPGVSYAADARAVARKVESEMLSGSWSLIAAGDGNAVKAKANMFDALVMSAHVRSGKSIVSSDLHIGCAVGGGMMIHIEKGSGCSYLAMDDPEVVRRIKAVYRPKALCS